MYIVCLKIIKNFYFIVKEMALNLCIPKSKLVLKCRLLDICKS